MSHLFPFISTTRLHIRIVRYVLPFFEYILGISCQIKRAQGFLGGKLLYEPMTTFWTMTVWTAESEMRAFQTSDAHGAAMPKLLDWCDEASIAHWIQQDTNLPDWQSAHKRMVNEGRLSKIHHPSLAQVAGQITRPHWSPFEIRLKPT